MVTQCIGSRVHSTVSPGQDPPWPFLHFMMSWHQPYTQGKGQGSPWGARGDTAIADNIPLHVPVTVGHGL